MNRILQVFIQQSTDKQLIDISQLVISIDWSTTMLDQPGKVELTYVDDNETHFKEGSKIAILDAGKGIFSGFVFKRERSEDYVISITAYDQMRYLQNKDTVIFPIMTSSEIFAKICTEQKLSFNKVHTSTYKCAARVQDGKSYYEMINDAIIETRNNTGQWFMIRDNYGILEHVNVGKLITNLVIGDESLITNYGFTSSIDEETYNIIKLQREDSKTKQREIYVLPDPSNVANWGRLQLFETVNSDSNLAQIKARAEAMLQLHNRPQRTLAVTCIGDSSIQAGSGLFVSIAALRDEKIPYNQTALVYECSHSWTDNSHTMTLSLELI